VRCHDDIGWTFSDEDAFVLDVNSYHHRQFLNAFYTARFAGTFARAACRFKKIPKQATAASRAQARRWPGLKKR
jgi:hypothetical protein